MCRFIAYVGEPILLNKVLYDPKNSLIKQSIHARGTDEPLNGDGFGIGWYTHEMGATPGVFASTQPAWNDRNLINIAPKIRSDCFFAHVRSASVGSVSLVNCHPFYFDRWLFMHNGGIGGFTTIKRHLRRKLSDDIYNWLQGQTDSEHFFALFLHMFAKKKGQFTVESMAKILEETIKELHSLQNHYDVHETTYLNIALTDGRNVIAMRYISNMKDNPLSLFYSEGGAYECHESGVCRMYPSKNGNKAILIASEKLDSYRAEWKEVPVNHMLLVKDDLTTSLRRVSVQDIQQSG